MKIDCPDSVSKWSTSARCEKCFASLIDITFTDLVIEPIKSPNRAHVICSSCGDNIYVSAPDDIKYLVNKEYLSKEKKFREEIVSFFKGILGLV